MQIGSRVKSYDFGCSVACVLSDSIFALSMRVGAYPVVRSDRTWSGKFRSVLSSNFCEKLFYKSASRHVSVFLKTTAGSKLSNSSVVENDGIGVSLLLRGTLPTCFKT